MAKPDKPWENLVAPETVLTHSGRDPFAQHGFVNTPVTRGSTVVFPTLDDLLNGKQPFRYGRTGNPSSRSVEDIVNELEGAAGTRLAPSGLSAISVALMTCLDAGDEVLVTDSAYEPTRRVCDGVLARMGISTRFYDPRIGAGIADLMRENTRAVFVESPGSLTFEVQDLPAIADAAHSRGARVIVDNSWATPLYYKPFALGADIVVHAATKMLVGHSDASIGTVSANADMWDRLALTHRQLGICAAPDDAFLTSRGLRTLHLRMKAHQDAALELAAWLETHEGVSRVLHPALPSHPDHALFRRDFTGAGSLFSFVLPPAPQQALAAMTDQLELFGLGYSWGGYESLLLPAFPPRTRTATRWDDPGQLIRLHVGFEAIEDLKAELRDGIARYIAAM